MTDIDTTTVTIDFVVQETAKAFLVEVDGEQSWIPKSQIIDGDLNPGDESVEIEVTTFIAEDRGWV